MTQEVIIKALGDGPAIAFGLIVAILVAIGFDLRSIRKLLEKDDL